MLISEGITVWTCNVDVLVCHSLLNFSFNSDLCCCLNLSLTRQLVRNVYSLLTNVSLSKLGNIYSQREDKYIFSKRRKYIFQGRKKYKKKGKNNIFKRILFKKKINLLLLKDVYIFCKESWLIFFYPKRKLPLCNRWS